MLHYTWGTLYFKGDKQVWRFDKRDWTTKEEELKVGCLLYMVPVAACGVDTVSPFEAQANSRAHFVWAATHKCRHVACLV